MERHFYEALEREIKYQHEYENLEHIVVCEKYINRSTNKTESINNWIEQNFRSWEHRGSFISFMELREHLGFYIKYGGNSELFRHDCNMRLYFLYCEMIYNLTNRKSIPFTEFVAKQIRVFNDTSKYVIEKSGFEVKKVGNEIQIVEKNAVASEVAEIVPELADVIIEYNHYLLKGAIDRKQELLKKLADALEPRRKQLDGICHRMTDDFFCLVNKMNVRHNNSDPLDKNYTPQIAEFSKEEMESWYDIIYEQGLALYVILDQQERNKKIEMLGLKKK